MDVIGALSTAIGTPRSARIFPRIAPCSRGSASSVIRGNRSHVAQTRWQYSCVNGFRISSSSLRGAGFAQCSRRVFYLAGLFPALALGTGPSFLHPVLIFTPAGGPLR
jgi:hypothetical protein